MGCHSPDCKGLEAHARKQLPPVHLADNIIVKPMALMKNITPMPLIDTFVFRIFRQYSTLMTSGLDPERHFD